MKTLRLAVLLGALCTSPALRAADLPTLSPIPNSLGVNTGMTSLQLTDDDFQKMNAARLHYIRISVNWNDIEKTRGSYTLDGFDKLKAQMDHYHIHPVYIIMNNNPLYNTDKIDFNEPAEREGFAAFAAAVVKRYDAPGVIWELGNEQNTDSFWKASTRGNTITNARERAINYMALADVTLPAIRTASPHAFVITGGVININWDFTRAWLDEIFQRGTLTKFDGIGFHLYGNQNDSNQPETRVIIGIVKLRTLIATYHGPPNFPLFQTEFGMNLSNKDTSGPLPQRELQQAQIDIRMYLLTQMLGLKLNIWYEWHWPGWVEGGDNHALLNPDGTPRPVYQAVCVLTQQLDGYTFDSRIPLTNPSDFALVFKKDAAKKVVVWTTGDTHDVTIPLTSGAATLNAISMLGDPRTLQLSDGKITESVTGSPIYISLP